jgi:hypothetical protein
MRSAPLSIGFGGDIDSKTLAQWSERVVSDLKEARTFQETAKEKAELVLLLQSYEDLFAARHREELAAEFRLLRRDLQADGLQAGAVSLDIPLGSATVLEGHSMTAYGVLLPPILSTVNRIPSDKEVVITVSPASNGGSILDSETLSAVDHRYDTVWLRRVEYPLSTPVASVEAQVEIQLPSSVPTTRLNLLSLLPYPSWGLDVVTIEARNEQDVWIEVFGEKRNTGPLISLFSAVQTDRIRVHLRQRHPLIFGDKQIFVLGIRDIAALSVTTGSTLQVEIPVALPKSGMWITGVETIPTVNQARQQVIVNGAETLPVYIASQEAIIELTISSNEIGPLSGVTIRTTA